MASSLLALIDDIASLLDDVSAMTKVAANKTAGVLGDDLALNAQQVSGVNADRELPVVWAVARGSLVNKAILVPAALAISAFAPWAVQPLLMAGGLYLCYEGVEKLAHRRAKADPKAAALAAAAGAGDVTPINEAEQIKGAVRTDFVLSAEIIVIALGTVAGQPLAQQLTVLVAIGLLMTVGVYGLVAGIVKIDDLGLWLVQRTGSAARAIGRALLAFAPWLMRTLGVVGTLAMFMVGGSILAHGLHGLSALVAHWATPLGTVGRLLVTTLAEVLIGVAAGALALAAVRLWSRLRGGAPRPH